MQTVAHLRDIEAPREEVFDTVVNLDRRMQLSPLWGLSKLLEVSSNYPMPGSRYRIQILPGAPFGLSQGTLNGAQSALVGLAEFLMVKLGQTGTQPDSDDAQPAEAPPEQDDHPVEHVYIVIKYQPPNIFSYQLDDDCKTMVTWSFKPIASGTRLSYEECFCDESVCDENFIPTVHRVINEWLTNIKRYSELRGRPWRRLVKWVLNRFYLKLRPDQRRVVLLMFMMQVIGLATFVFAVLVWGIPQLFF